MSVLSVFRHVCGRIYNVKLVTLSKRKKNTKTYKMSVNTDVHLPNNEITPPKVDKVMKPLFPKQTDCSYVSCYCEENVWKLCQDVSLRVPEELDRCYAVFISNSCRTVPLWRQRAGREDDRLVIWDYHVIFLYSWDPKTCLVYDLDSELPFPTFFHKYVTETFRTDQVLKSDFHRFFRVVPAKQFLQNFASDRRHMKRPDGSWIKPPPPYPAILSMSSASSHNLDEYINMDQGSGPGQVMNLTDFVRHFYKMNK